MACVTSPNFSVMINGSLEGFFQGRKELRQGDLLSPFLFVLMMEVLSRLLNKPPKSFRFHDWCEHVGLTHLAFIDDLMIFCAVERVSLEFVKQVLVEFAELSRLVTNVRKSFMFVAGVDSSVAMHLTAFMGFSLGSLPIRYLGLSLLAVLLACVTHEVERLLRSYLWKGSVGSWGGAQVAWDEVCLQKGEGELGVTDVALWNQAAIMKLLWLLLVKLGSLWVAWMEAYILRGRSLWAIRCKVGKSWCLRAILLCRNRFKHLVCLMVGDGRSCFVWWDPWLPEGAILDKYGASVVGDANSSLDVRLSEFMDGEGGWRWPIVSWELLEIWGLIQAVGPRVRGEDYWV
ncbi:uncharacterized protein LOC120076201 [Benincasa hispida]|uniref:uncharacterized protein LOC120076201 n=1 Tax=Benincasa hispida TaxID=102211 RepID=UPI001901D807|nr:uncharacterized protein LOC120076201 [Benincasa hispida]